MKLLLCSDFSDVGYRWVKKFFSKTQGLKVLFVGYAKFLEYPIPCQLKNESIHHQYRSIHDCRSKNRILGKMVIQNMLFISAAIRQ